MDLDDMEPLPRDWRDLIDKLRHPEAWRKLTTGERRVLADLAQSKRKLPKDAVSYRTHFHRIALAHMYAWLRASGEGYDAALALAAEGEGVTEAQVKKAIRHFIASYGAERWAEYQESQRRAVTEWRARNGA